MLADRAFELLKNWYDMQEADIERLRRDLGFQSRPVSRGCDGGSSRRVEAASNPSPRRRRVVQVQKTPDLPRVREEVGQVGDTSLHPVEMGSFKLR